MNEAKFLDSIYKSVPGFKCIEGCTDCCGPVFTTKIEAERLGVEVGTLTNKPGETKCRFAGEQGCTVHDKRPMMCRLFGSSNLEKLACPHGRGPNKPLKVNQTNELISKYKVFVILDANKVKRQAEEMMNAA